MKKQKKCLPKAYRLLPVLMALLLVVSVPVWAQVNQVIVQLGALEDVELTPDNIFSFQVQNNTGAVRPATIKGTVQYRSSPLRFSYTFKTTLAPGLNSFSKEKATGVQWSFSDNALKELFQQYRQLPQGTYEYCVEVTTQKPGPEVIPEEPVDACTYHRMDDVFLINLVTPEDGAKLYEPYPSFNWVVNYPFASMLTYRIRVAEQKQGQNAVNAITRNNPVYSERNVMATTQTYPLTARPLEKWQWYVWTVDAYYKGILLGGAETWQFMIVEDSVLKTIPRDPAFLDVRREHGMSAVYAIGKLKVKYELPELRSDELGLRLLDKNNKEVKLKNNKLQAVYGENFFEIDLVQGASLKHLQQYTMEISSASGALYKVVFRYVNPELVN